MPFYVLKLGGSLIDSARSLIFKLIDLEREGYSFLVVPGGGPIADLVRRLSVEHGLSDEAAHWMAILAMEQYAYFMADGNWAILTTKVARCEGVKVFLPYQSLQEDDCDLEHTWDYTSDAVAALIAKKLDCDLIKATDVDGIMMNGKTIREIKATTLIGIKTCIDQGSIKLLEGRSCWILNGANVDDFINAIRKGRGGTIVNG
jgi:5-(aminomethyl)-3-furanmethanol phosphate kinase